MSDIEDIAEDTRTYAMECSTELSEIAHLVGQLLMVERARAAVEGLLYIEGQYSCACGFPISTDRDKCRDCQLAEAIAELGGSAHEISNR